MVEFKLVVSDPEARGKSLVVKVVGFEGLKYSQEEKSGKSLPTALVNQATLNLINAPYGVVNVRVWKDRSKNEKVKFTFRVKSSGEVPENTIYVPKELITEKLGVEEAVGELSRAKAFQVVIDGDRARRLVGLKVGDVVDSSIVGIPGKLLLITGGSDNTGFPMIPSLPGQAKKALLLTSPPGHLPKEDGERRRKYVRGNTIGEELVQVNAVITSPK
ncbi:MAG: 30S ribosomal protein S6e [Sulfolobales archaeon]|nr:30S ribosomal protein S6e [Sulfolobales archaeon]MCX8186549.1 30S ribosomal protein S6e [Sulfolobales archaeon]MDW7970101.1 30S ribosomal protein S6e [Sulfolobales archaeon]